MTAAATTGASTGAMGTMGAYYQLAQTLVGGYYGRQTMRMQAQQVRWQNDIGQRQNALANRNALSQYSVARSQAALSRAQAESSNKIRDANNLRGQVQADLTNWSRSVNNQRRLDNAGRMHDAGMSNLLRQREEFTGASLEQQLANAETMGAVSVHAALSGTQGSSIDGMERAVLLRDQRRTFYAERQQGYVDYDTLSQIVGIVPQAAADVDLTVTQANGDFGFDVGASDPLPPVPTVKFNEAYQNPWGNGLSDAATWFMDPDNRQAANMVAGQLDSWFSQTEPDYKNNPFIANDI